MNQGQGSTNRLGWQNQRRGGGGAGALTSLPVGNFVFVNPLGDDLTGTREDQSKPFATLGAAKNAAFSGDTVYVFGGTYSVVNTLHKDGVKWHFIGRPTLNCFVSRVWQDNNIQTSIEISGDAIINQQAFGNVLRVENDNTTVNASFHKVTGLGTHVIHLFGGSGIINIETTLEVTVVNRACQLEGNASYTFYIDEIICNAPFGGINSCITAHNDPVDIYIGYCIFNVRIITKSAAHPTAAVHLEYGNNTGTVVVNVSDKIQCFSSDNTFLPNRTCVMVAGGNLIINGNIEGNFHPAITLSGGLVKNCIHNGNAINNGTRELIGQGASGGFWANNNGTLKLNGIYESSNPVTIQAGDGGNNKLTIGGKIINTSTDVGITSGVKIDNNMTPVIFYNTVIIMDLAAGTPECISSQDLITPKDIKILHSLGSNANASASINNLIPANNLVVDTNYE
jgi:hypothetical protein